MTTHERGRLGQVDALRGVAALAVALFHFTSRFVELYGSGQTPLVAVRHGHLGVNLFFIISGFVIFMTLARTQRPMDFIVSRFSRLFPSYWAAIVLTFLVMLWLGLPHKAVGLKDALANFLMIHGIFGVPHVDGVYWTLEVEMLFYAGMFLLYRLRWLGQTHWVLLGMLGVRLLYTVMERVWGIDLPWIAFRLLILQYIPWFSLGICIYQLSQTSPAQSRAWPLGVATAAILTLAIVESVLMGALALAFASMVFLAASGHLRWLEWPVFIWLGAISYPLYLLHENIGWSVQLRLLAAGVPIDVTILLVLALALAAATAMTHSVERPAMRWIRERYRAHLASTR